MFEFLFCLFQPHILASFVSYSGKAEHSWKNIFIRQNNADLNYGQENLNAIRFSIFISNWSPQANLKQWFFTSHEDICQFMVLCLCSLII